MKELPKRKTTRLRYADYNQNGSIFLTICTENRRCILSRIVSEGVSDVPNIELTKYGQIADKYIHQLSDFYHDLSVESYVIMPNHIHILLRITSDLPVGTDVLGGPHAANVPNSLQKSILSRFLSTFKRFCNKECGKNIWQYRSFDHIIRDRADYEQHLRYIYENPIRWQNDELYAEIP